MKIPCVLSDKIEVSEYHASKIRQAVKDNGSPIRAEIVTLMPESNQQRRYLMGSLIPLLVFLDGNDHRDSKTCERYFEFLKLEFYPEVLTIKKKVHVFAGSTKGSNRLNKFIERVQEYICDNYGLEFSNPVFNPSEYKKWTDELLTAGFETFISYALFKKWINLP